MKARATIVLVFLFASACGGGDGGNTPSPDSPDADDTGAQPDDDSPTDDAPAELSDQQRIDAATQTANTNPLCSLTELPEGFYWEIGDRDGQRASGSVTGTNTPSRTQVIAIASSSKWVYATYVLQNAGSVRSSDIPYLHFTSGEVFPATSAKEAVCGPGQTVGECAEDVTLTPAAVDKFYYSAGHFQYHAATTMGLGAMHAAELTTEITSQVGAFDFTYLQTNLAGALNASASGYAQFLQRMLRGEYVMADALDSNKVCASEACTSGAVLSPAPPDEAWNYGLGHWVEDDPAVGDHAFSSAGALGFYPWIDSTKTWYGVLARRADSTGGGQGVISTRCGRLIRKAWVTGIAVTD